MKNKKPNIRIVTVRDQKVVFDVDLARVYGVTTKRLKRAIPTQSKALPKGFRLPAYD
jgi:hypothetical protein